jgi:hypothetical protein
MQANVGLAELLASRLHTRTQVQAHHSSVPRPNILAASRCDPAGQSSLITNTLTLFGVWGFFLCPSCFTIVQRNPSAGRLHFGASVSVIPETTKTLDTTEVTESASNVAPIHYADLGGRV